MWRRGNAVADAWSVIYGGVSAAISRVRFPPSTLYFSVSDDGKLVALSLKTILESTHTTVYYYTEVKIMNIQIFGKAKSFDTKKAERYFKERGIKFQSIDLVSKGMSKGEFDSVLKAVGDIEKLIDPKAKGATADLLKYLGSMEEKREKLLEEPSLIAAPVVRNGRQATVGYCPDIWKNWE